MQPDAVIKIILCFWMAALGAVLGSGLDCAVLRWAAGKSWVRGRSQCDDCGHELGAGDLVPIFSYLLRRGRCRYCGGKIPAQCFAAEVAGALVFLSLAARFGLTLELGQWAVLAALLLAVSLCDWNKRVLPGPLLAAMAVNRAAWFLPLGGGAAELLEILLAFAVPVVLLALVLLAERVMGREVMGGGDIKLLFVLALYLSWIQLLLTLLAGCLLGLAWAAASGRGGGGKTMPFGPFLAVGVLAALTVGGPVIEWYLGLF